jgi:Universal stress protein family
MGHVCQAKASEKPASMILSRKEKLDMSEGIDNPATSKDSLSQPPSKLPSTLRHILAPTDFSPNSEKAVNCAILVAKLLGAKLTLLHVVPEPSALDYAMQGYASFGGDAEILEDAPCPVLVIC